MDREGIFFPAFPLGLDVFVLPDILFTQEARPMRTLAVALLAALFVPNVLAQSNSPITVQVISETEDSERIVQALAARIGSTTRYKVTGSGSQLWLDIMCLTMEKVVIHPSTRGMDGFVCFHSIGYHPAELKPLYSVLGTQKLVTGKFADVVEDIFDKFVIGTSDERLKSGRDEMAENVRFFCIDPEHRAICGQYK
jgi:hypothetical protein